MIRRPIWALRAACGGSRVTVGVRFSLMGDFECRGPGQVIVGDDVIVGGWTTPYTHNAKATIRIGHRCFVNGTRFGCSELIELGDDGIFADTRITDSDYHLTHAARRAPGQSAPVKPVFVDKNVWICAASAVLKGSRIGRDAVIGYGAVVTGQELPAGRLYVGNPARDIGPIPATPPDLESWVP
jgi:acetyltransferase-like isoleucine patch superfamily enzyme